ncbi:MAG: type II toxin-antitoxin system prevent-host-death family antitoxin [Rickettsiaceae bacterium]|nr:type II toxin-antitoxin system prevent-host-death family antitoxin [Rickettsiaceae bacterium]
MEFVNIHEAKTHLSQYIKRVKDGGEIIVICKNGVPICQLAEYKGSKNRKIGILKGKISISDNFNHPLPNEIIGPYI